MTTSDMQGTIARVAVSLDQARGLLVQARDESARKWPEGMVNEGVQPSLEYRVYIDIQMLLEDYVEPGLSLARGTSGLTNARVTREWQADRNAAARGAEEMAALFAAPAGDEVNTRALRDHDFSPADELEELSTSVRKALASLSGSALAFSAMLRNASELGLDVGLSEEQMASITEAIETLGRRVSVLEPLEDA